MIPCLNIISQVSAYGTSLKNNADFLARDLLDGHESKWIEEKVGVRQRK
jgi:hypothetical protein